MFKWRVESLFMPQNLQKWCELLLQSLIALTNKSTEEAFMHAFSKITFMLVWYIYFEGTK